MVALADRDIFIQRPDTFAVWATRHEHERQRFRLFRHIEYTAGVVTEAILQGRGRVIISMPPQHGKSMFLSRWLPIWYEELWPELRVISASYSDRLVRDHSKYVRDQFLYNPCLTTKLKADSQRANQWNTTAGGGMLATTIGGQVSGFPGDLMLVDDPYKGWRDAWSPTVRGVVQDWFESELYARRQENTTIIVLHTRWHPQDLTGYLQTKHADDWQLIRLPAVCDSGDDLLGRAIGDPLCPELHSLRDLKGSMTSRAIWDAVYQQDPRGLGDTRCYSHYTERNRDDSVTLVDQLPIHFSADFNIRPGMHAIVGQHIEQEDLITAVHEFHETGMNVRDLMEAFVAWWKQEGGASRFPEVHVFGDAAGRQRTMTTSESCYDLIKQALQHAGIPFRIRVPGRAPSVRNSIDDFNEALRDMQGDIHYRVHPRCERLIRDLAELGTDENNLPDKTDMDMSHASDAERYRVTRIRPIGRATIREVGRVNV